MNNGINSQPPPAPPPPPPSPRPSPSITPPPLPYSRRVATVFLGSGSAGTDDVFVLLTNDLALYSQV